MARRLAKEFKLAAAVRRLPAGASLAEVARLRRHSVVISTLEASFLTMGGRGMRLLQL